MKQIYFFTLIFLNFLVTGQKTSDTLRLFYAINSTVPLDQDPLRNLNSGGNFSQIQIIGYTDFLHSPEYNITLSQKRADHIRELILKKHPELREKISSCTGKG